MALLKIKNSENNWVDVPGLKGEPGDKPIKGIDYFTEEEILEVTEIILSTLNAPQLFPPIIALDDYNLTITPAPENGAFKVSFGLYAGGILIDLFEDTAINLSSIESPFDLTTVSVKAHAQGFLPSVHSNYVTWNKKGGYELEPNEYGVGVVLYSYSTISNDYGTTINIIGDEII